MTKNIQVLFIQSQFFFGSDSMIHSLMMKYFNREYIKVYAACNPGSSKLISDSFKALKKIPDLTLRPTNFGFSVNNTSKTTILKNSFLIIPTMFDLLRLAWYIKKNKIQIIHGTEKPRDAFYGVLLSKITGAKSVIHLHVKAENWISPLTRWAMGQADAIIGVSDFVAKSVVEMGYSPEKTHYVLNSLDLSGWNYEVDSNIIRKEFDIEPELPLIAIISRLFHWKGHTELVKALAKVKDSGQNFKLLIVGEDDPRAVPGRGSYTAELKTLTQELGLTEQIKFIGFRNDIPQIMAACDIYAMPSYEEPCAVVYLEAMAMQKPIIALNSGGTPQLIEHGKSGLLSEPQDIDQLSDNILTLIKNPELRVKLGMYGRQRVEEYFTPRRMADDVEKIYRSLVQ